MTRMVEYILKVFPAEYLNRNVTFTLFFFVVIAARLILVKCPKKYSYMLWSLLGIKAIFDFGFLTLSDIVERLFAKPEAASYVAGENTGFVGKTFTILGQVNLTETANEIEEAANKGFDKWYLVFGAEWALGVLLFIVMGIMSYKDLSRKVKLSFENGDVRVCDYIDSPMVFGIAKPRIYVPSGVEIDKLEYVIKHERAHLRRGDTFYKLMAFAILSFYWMNPLAWIAFKLFNLDMELSCDEAVLQKETVSVKEAYGKWLVFFASKGKVYGPVPTAFGETDIEGLLPHPVQIAGVLGNSHGALIGQLCFDSGEGKTTYGTGSSVMFNVGESPVAAPNGMVCSVGFSLFDHTYYVLEGHVHSSGAVLDWITDNLRLVDSNEDTQTLALSVPNNGGVYFVPAFSGLGSPWWVPDAKAMVCGLTMQTTKAHVVRAALESIAYQVADVVELAARDIKTPLRELCIDGESAKNDFLMQFQADVLGIPVKRLGLQEASGLGSAILNCCACGIYTSVREIKELRKISEICLPEMKPDERIRNRQGWLHAVHTVMLASKHN